MIYIMLYALSIPWYLPDLDPMPVWYGFPFWVVISFGVCVIIACFTSFVVKRYWLDAD